MPVKREFIFPGTNLKILVAAHLMILQSARETGIYRWIHQFAIEYTKMYFCEKSLL